MAQTCLGSIKTGLGKVALVGYRLLAQPEHNFPTKSTGKKPLNRQAQPCFHVHKFKNNIPNNQPPFCLPSFFLSSSQAIFLGAKEKSVNPNSSPSAFYIPFISNLIASSAFETLLFSVDKFPIHHVGDLVLLVYEK